VLQIVLLLHKIIFVSAMDQSSLRTAHTQDLLKKILGCFSEKLSESV
jgi:hypothetical protein